MPAKSKPESPPTPTPSPTGLNPHTAAALSYVLGWLTGLIFLLIEKDKFVRFHALQSILVFGGATVLIILLNATTILSPLVSLVWIGEFVLWLVLIYKSYHGEKYQLPWVGEWTDRQLAKMK
jgi:uncharacterized membrane protein